MVSPRWEGGHACSADVESARAEASSKRPPTRKSAAAFNGRPLTIDRSDWRAIRAVRADAFGTNKGCS
jgi:hypothetical protein